MIHVQAKFKRTSGVEPTQNAPESFSFERPSAPVNWSRLSSVEVAQVRERGEAGTVQHFLGDIAMGDVEASGGAATRGADDPRSLHAYRVLQLQLQYLLFSHQALSEKASAAEHVSAPLLAVLLASRKPF